MKRLITVLLLVALTACTSNPPREAGPTFTEQIEQALSYGDPELRLSALEALEPGSDEERIRLLAVQAETVRAVDPAQFRLYTGRLYHQVKGRPLHTLAREVQALAYFGAQLNKLSDGSDVAIRQVREAVDSACLDWASHMTSQRQTLQEMIQMRILRNLSRACHEAVHATWTSQETRAEDVGRIAAWLSQAMATAYTDPEAIEALDRLLGPEDSPLAQAHHALTANLEEAGIHLDHLVH